MAGDTSGPRDRYTCHSGRVAGINSIEFYEAVKTKASSVARKSARISIRVIFDSSPAQIKQFFFLFSLSLTVAIEAEDRRARRFGGPRRRVQNGTEVLSVDHAALFASRDHPRRPVQSDYSRLSKYPGSSSRGSSYVLLTADSPGRIQRTR